MGMSPESIHKALLSVFAAIRTLSSIQLSCPKEAVSPAQSVATKTDKLLLSAKLVEVRKAITGYERTTRDILVVSGYLQQHRVSILINHWPSRRGRKLRSAPYRMKAARLHRKITDSLQRKFPQGKIISMGDYNDNPNDKSMLWIKGKKTTKYYLIPWRK